MKTNFYTKFDKQYKYAFKLIDENENLMMIYEQKLMAYNEEKFLKKPFHKNNTIRIGTKQTHQEYYDQMTKEETEINNEFYTFVKHGYNNAMSYSKTNIILKMFQYEFGDVITDPVEEFELTFLQSTNHQVIYANSGSYKKHLWCYDINSTYPSLLNDKWFEFPISRPIYSLSDDINDILNERGLCNKGIYKLIIKEIIDDDADIKIKRKKNTITIDNANGWYTHYCVNYMIENNIEFKMDMDNEFNIIEYEKWINKPFKRQIEKLYALKKTGNKTASDILKRLHGKLQQYDTYEKSPDEFEIDKWSFILPRTHLHRKSKDTFINHKKCFTFNGFGRIIAFILAFGRIKLLNYINTIMNAGYTVYRCHTDSILTNAPPEFMGDAISDKMGFLKIDTEYPFGCVVTNPSSKPQVPADWVDDKAFLE